MTRSKSDTVPRSSVLTVLQVENPVECYHCKRSFPLDAMISGELIRQGMAELIRKHNPDWDASRMLCPDCLNLFRSEYVEDALEDERGELSRLDIEVLRSLKEQETVTADLNLAFEKNLSMGCQRRFLAKNRP